MKGLMVMAVVILASGLAMATEPCDDFGECKVLIEINSTDGDVGFHFLMDGDDLNSARIHDPSGMKVFEDQAKGPLLDQKLTETFAESAEPLCWFDPDAMEDWDEVVTLEEFLNRWEPGTYEVSGMSDGGEKSEGETELTFDLPAAPQNLSYAAGVISWTAGNDLGNCASNAELTQLVLDGVLENHPAGVTVDQWEIVFEPDVEPDHPADGLKFTVRVAGDIAVKQVTVPAEYLADLPADTPAKFEIGAIGGEDNATFTEQDGICVNETTEGCD